MRFVRRRIRLPKIQGIALFSLAITSCSWKTYDDFFSSNNGAGQPGMHTNGGETVNKWETDGGDLPTWYDSGASNFHSVGGADGLEPTANNGSGGMADLGGNGGGTMTDRGGGAGSSAGGCNCGSHLGGSEVAGDSSGGSSGIGGNDGTGSGGSCVVDAGEAGGSTTRDGGEGAFDDGAPQDGATDSGVSGCDNAFGTPEQITGLEVAGDLWGPTLYADGLTMFFSVVDGGPDAIYKATRVDRGTVFSRATKVTITGFSGRQATPFLSYDSLTLYFVSDRSAGADRDLWFARRTSVGNRFSNAQPLKATSDSADDRRPWVSRDELTLLFASDRSGGLGDMDIWTATRGSPTGSFSTPVSLPGASGSSRDESPILSADGLTLYLASSREGGMGQQDIWKAARSDTNREFGPLAPVKELNSTEVEVDMTLSADEREMFFASSRSGKPQIWRSVRKCGDGAP
jgi:hypothetical protein